MSTYAGVTADLYVGGAATTLTNEACTLTDDYNFQVTAAAHRVLDEDTARTWEYSTNGSDYYAISDIDVEDLLIGHIHTSGQHADWTNVRVSGKYIPMAQCGNGQNWDFTVQQDLQDISLFGDTWKKNRNVFRSISGKFGRLYLDMAFFTAMDAVVPIIVKFIIDVSSNKYFIVRVTVKSSDVKASVSDVTKEDVAFEGYNNGYWQNA